MLKKFNCLDCSPIRTPFDQSMKLTRNIGEAVSQLEYSKVFGCLTYSITNTRSYIAFVVGKLNRYTSNPSTHHWHEVRRVLKYLKKTMDFGLTYGWFSSVIEGYSDASWIIYDNPKFSF